MTIWHLTPDAPRLPRRVAPGQHVELVIGTWPVALGQSVRVTWKCQHGDGTHDGGESSAIWRGNTDVNSYWSASIGSFHSGDRVSYTVHGSSASNGAHAPAFSFEVRPLYLALLWHQHQPLYRNPAAKRAAGSYLFPWVRLHALRDYYSMAAIAADHRVHVTFNLTPVLLQQIDDYVYRGATDRALDLTKRPAEGLSRRALEEILSTFFDADWHRQIHPHARYRELLDQRTAGRPFSAQDVRDVQMWFNLAWFGHEFRERDVELVTGEIVSVKRFVQQQRDFTHAEVEAMVGEQYKILRAIVPLHRDLQAVGAIEVSTTPAFHPILPLLIDTNQARVDRPGAILPRRFVHPEDATAQVAMAVTDYRTRFGHPPAGTWPAEGAVSAGVAQLLGAHGLTWMATDRGVLARSGRWGYDVSDPNVLCRPYRFADDGKPLAVFFRDSALSDSIGFRYQGFDDPRLAADDFVRTIESGFLERLDDDHDDRLLTVVLDGENAWGAYADDGRPFLHALYERLAADARFKTVTFSEYLAGNAQRGVPSHPIDQLTRVHELATGSWIDEAGSAAGVDLGTWIGEAEENVAWGLLANAREAVRRAASKDPQAAVAALQPLYAAEGSDWFWWLGADQDSRNDAEFDELFRRHVGQSYRALGAAPPAALGEFIVARHVLWRFTRPVHRIRRGDRLTIRTNCPGRLSFHVEDTREHSLALTPVGGVMAGARRFQVTVGPFPSWAKHVWFRFTCEDPACSHRAACCSGLEQTVALTEGSHAREAGAAG